MAYARFEADKTSDLYLLASITGGWSCISCRLHPTGGWYDCVDLVSLQEARNHVDEHIGAGHAVPGYCITRLDEEIEEAKSPLQRLTEGAWKDEQAIDE